MMVSTMRRGRLYAGLALLMVVGLAQAANLSVNPVKLTLDSGRSIASLTLNNRGDEPVVMQAAVKAWSVSEGDDVYADTEALIVTPPVFTVPGGQSQVVRVGLRHPGDSEVEQAFRVFLEQAPATPGGADSGDAGESQQPRSVQVLLRIGIPVFIPPKGEPNEQVVWRAEVLDNGKLRITGINKGNTHVAVNRLALLNADGNPAQEAERLTYLLPGTTRYWTLDKPAALPPPYRLKAWTRTGELEAEINPARP